MIVLNLILEAAQKDRHVQVLLVASQCEEKLKQEAERLGKGSFAFAFYMDLQKEEFYTETLHYTVIDARGHRNCFKNMITGASHADVALNVIPADGNGNSGLNQTAFPPSQFVASFGSLWPHTTGTCEYRVHLNKSPRQRE